MRKPALIGLMVIFALSACKKGEEAKTEEGKTAEVSKAAPAPPPAAGVVKLGQALAGAKEVALADLFKDPAAWEGKTVRVSGQVKDFCSHRRAWFGVVAQEGQLMLRVFAAPRFQAPADCLGKTATAEGKVEVLTMKPEAVQHYAKEHKFLTKEEIESGQPIKRPIVRAFGAEFK
jgi:hypothetical protein